MSKKRCGIISLTGFSNAGKSTLINRLINKKVSIVSSKVQTTRNEIRGIINYDCAQYIFIDTPGIIKNPKKIKESHYLNPKDFNQIDINLFIFDSSKEKLPRDIKAINETLANFKNNILVLNKIDLIPKKELLSISMKMNDSFKFSETFMISGKKNLGIIFLLKKIKDYLPEKKWIYKTSSFTDKNLEFQISEITREKVFQLINQELPYELKIVSSIKRISGNIKIFQSIVIFKESHKAIIIGKNGSKIKQIGMRARVDIEKIFKKKIYLDLVVVVKRSIKSLE